jgi:hypothetical protein
VRVPLAAKADDGYGLSLEETQISVLVVQHLC